MHTEILSQTPQVTGGRKIITEKNSLRNPRLHRCLEQMSRLTLFLLESDSNNSSSHAKPSDVRYVRQQWDICKEEFEFNVAEENNDLPTGKYEYAYTIEVIEPKEIQRVTNVKIRAVLAEVWDTMNVILSIDTANLQGWVSVSNQELIRQRLGFVDRVMDRWVGGGSDSTDTGLDAPSYEILGRIVPSLNSDWAERLEPSKDVPVSRFPDAPDLDPAK